jgi:hypothetical protein
MIGPIECLSLAERGDLIRKYDAKYFRAQTRLGRSSCKPCLVR